MRSLSCTRVKTGIVEGINFYTSREASASCRILQRHKQRTAIYKMSPSCAFANAAYVSAFTRSRFAASILTTCCLQPRRHASRWTATSTERPATVPPAPVEDPSIPEEPRRLRKGDNLDLVVSKLAYGGGAVAYVPESSGVAGKDVGMPVYAPKGACPGELVRCAITKVRRRNPEKIDLSIKHDMPVGNRSYAEALFVNSLTPSPAVVQVPCKHFGHFKLGGGGCGGCSSMHVSYAEQLKQKQSQMNNVFAKVSARHGVSVLPLLGSENTLYYRNKMEFSFGRRWYESNTLPNENALRGPGDYEYALGLHAPQRFSKIVHIQECHIQNPLGNEILQYIRERSASLLLEPYDTIKNLGYFRNVGIRTAMNAHGELEVMVNLITSPCDVPDRLVPLGIEIWQKFPAVVCVLQNMSGVRGHHNIEHDRERLLAGSRKYIEQSLCGLTFRISANSFFQTNAEQAHVLYDQVRLAAKLTKSDTVLDLFCGTGTIGLALANDSKQIFGIDVVRSAIEDARVNSIANNITNAKFEQGNLEKLETIMDGAGVPKTDVVIMDPPRAGLHPDLVKYIAKCDARRIVYVSCNPVSQVRDLESLEELAEGKFRVSSIQPVDMFPNTPHVECVVSLERV